MQVLPIIWGCDYNGYNDCRDFNGTPLLRSDCRRFLPFSGGLTLLYWRFSSDKSNFFKKFQNFSQKGGLGMTQAVVPSLKREQIMIESQSRRLGR